MALSESWEGVLVHYVHNLGLSPVKRGGSDVLVAQGSHDGFHARRPIGIVDVDSPGSFRGNERIAEPSGIVLELTFEELDLGEEKQRVEGC